MSDNSPDPASDGLPPLRDVIRQYGLRARKSFGQNFILDLNLTRRIARGGGALDGSNVVEVGPGPGGLTRALLMEGAAHVTAIERDERCLQALADIAAHYPGRLSVMQDDALKIDWDRLGLSADRLIANLPYGVATELLVMWLSEERWPPWFDSAVLMFQKEVGERIVAQPGSKAYGRLSVLTQARTEARILFTLPPQAFTPAPAVDSALVLLKPLLTPLVGCSMSALSRVTAAAFGQRRKMLRSSLRQAFSNPQDALFAAGIDPTRRAESLSVPEFSNLAELLDRQVDGRI